MGRALHIYSNSAAAIATGNESPLFGGADGATELNAQFSVRQAGRFTYMGRKNLGGNGTNTTQLRVAGANGNNVVATSGTGWAEDATHYDVISANTLINFAYTDTGTDPSYAQVKVLFTANGDHCAYYGGATNAGVVYDLASTTSYLTFNSSLLADGDTTESNTQLVCRSAGTLRSFQVRITANARVNTSTFKTRKNTADGTASVAFGAGVTGLVIDDSNTDTLAAGDTFNASLTLDTGVQDLTGTLIAAAITSSTTHQSDMFVSFGGATRAASATVHYMGLGGAYGLFTTTTEANATIRSNFPATVGNIGIHLTANTYSGAASFIFRKSASSAITLNVGAGVTGWIEDTSTTTTITATDDICFAISGGTTGSITGRRGRVSFLDLVPTGHGGLHHITEGMGDVGDGPRVPQTLHTIDTGIAT